MGSDWTQEDAALDTVTVSILGSVLSRAERPAEMGTYLAEEIRELTGARCVLFIQCPETEEVSTHRVFGINPSRRRAWAESPAMQGFYDAVHGTATARLWHRDDPSEAAQLLRREGYGLSLAVPLCVGDLRQGAMLVLGLPDEQHMASLTSLLNSIAPAVALVLRNALAYAGQEQTIRERTASLRETNERLQVELSERRRAEDELRSTQRALSIRSSIAQVFLTTEDDQMYGSVLEIVRGAMRSPYGVFGYLNEAGDLVCASMTRDVWDQCQVAGKDIVFPRDTWAGVWGRALNEASTFQSSTGMVTPAGHIPMTRALATPLTHHEQVIGLLEVANKESEYDAGDVMLLESIAGYVAPVLHARLQRDTQQRARQRAEDEQRRLEAQLQHVQRLESIGVLAGGIAHDFNNILAAITGFSELALDALAPETMPASHVKRVLVASERAKELVRKILAFSREAPMEQRPVSMRTLVDDALGFARASFPATVEISATVAPTDLVVQADPTQIQQVILNICTNAEHAMRPTGGALRVALTPADLDEAQAGALGVIPPGQYALLAISDSGCGMDAATRDRVFEPFFTTKPAGQGSGLGLATSYGIVASHGGAMCVDSEVGLGTTFSVYLPVIGARPLDAPINSDALPTSQGRVLLVDDEPELADTAEQMLRRVGCEATVLCSSREAISMVRSDPYAFDLIMTDQTMPGMTGLDLVTEIRKVNADIPIIIMTGFSSQVTPETLEPLRIREVLNKPFTLRQFAEAVRRALGAP